jgi:hypothetical protein
MLAELPSFCFNLLEEFHSAAYPFFVPRWFVMAALSRDGDEGDTEGEVRIRLGDEELPGTAVSLFKNRLRTERPPVAQLSELCSSGCKSKQLRELCHQHQEGGPRSSMLTEH